MTTATLAVIAASFWTPYNAGQGTPCPAPRVSFVTRAAPELGTAPAGAVFAAFAYQQRGDCRVFLVRSVWRTLSRASKCTVLVHEIGHSGMGLPHSEDSHNVMYWEPPDIGYCIRVAKWWGKGRRTF